MMIWNEEKEKALVYFYKMGMPIRAIAEKLKLPYKTVENKVYRVCNANRKPRWSKQEIINLINNALVPARSKIAKKVKKCLLRKKLSKKNKK